MARIHELLRQLRLTNAALADDIEREVDVLGARRAFGLNFERHTPEAVELPGRPVRSGDKVHVLPPRGERPKAANFKLWRVVAIEGEGDGRVGNLEAHPRAEPTETATMAVADLVVVAEFRDPIYPGLVSTGRVENGGDKPFHTVINGENYHALQTLLFTHRGKVDAIYIDPPYNTGAKDWKYNNDYVESDDLYRHSKWLAFMERRLLLAKELLNPDDSVLIVTIDEKEYLRLGLLLEQTFPESALQMVTAVINPSGNSGDGFSRVEEYIFYVFVGNATPTPWFDNLLTDSTVDGRVTGGLSWESFLRSGVGNTRSARPNLCYPIVIDRATLRIRDLGEPLVGSDADRPTENGGHPVAWPVRSDGTLGMWRRDARAMRDLVAKGYAYVSSEDSARGTWSLKYLLGGTIERIESGEVQLSGFGDRGQVLAGEDSGRRRVAKTVWNRPSHNAGKHGSDLLRTILPGRRFPFPKALYAVEDALRFAVGSKPNATVVDFFSGSGTTAHAVMRINKQDGGRRVSISVSNNEVSADEQKGLRETGLRPGESDWEQWGICEYITKPRIRAAITGTTPSGDAIKGDYKFTDEFLMADGFEENVEFLTLTYEAPLRLRANRDFERISPLLWLRAGSRGRRIESLQNGWDVAEAYGVIADLDKTDEFFRALAAVQTATTAIVITDDDGLFESVVAGLANGVEPVRLYDAYFRNFEIDAMRGAR